MDSLTSMPYSGFEHGTFGAAAGFPNHRTAWSASYNEKLKIGRMGENVKINSKYHQEKVLIPILLKEFYLIIQMTFIE